MIIEIYIRTAEGYERLYTITKDYSGHKKISKKYIAVSNDRVMKKQAESQKSLLKIMKTLSAKLGYIYDNYLTTFKKTVRLENGYTSYLLYSIATVETDENISKEQLKFKWYNAIIKLDPGAKGSYNTDAWYIR